MKKSIQFLFVLLVISSVAFSQKVYFIYLQTEAQQPFYLRLDEKVYNSTSSGYLILSKLKDSTYSFSIGFPGNKWPEQKFTIPVRAKDHGFLVKDFGEKGWGLFDLQTLSVLMGTQAKSSTGIKTEPRQVSEFTAILARAADDPSLRERPVFASIIEEKPVMTQMVAVKEETKPPVPPVEDVAKNEKPKLAAKAPETHNTEDKLRGQTIAVTEKDGREDLKKDSSLEIVHTKPEESSTGSQEIKPDIAKEKPAENELVVTSSTKKEEPSVEKDKVKETNQSQTSIDIEKPPVTSGAAEYKRSRVTKWSESSTSEGFGLTFYDEYNGQRDTIRIIIPNPKRSFGESREAAKEEKKFLDIGEGSISGDSQNNEKLTSVAKSKKTPEEGCLQASESDFMRLRREMAAEDTDKEMISEARKVFKKKCFSVTQVRNLAALFLNDEGKYSFFEAARAFIADKENFSSLSSELKDKEYITRFRAMLE